jgi:hypothetical protein
MWLESEIHVDVLPPIPRLVCLTNELHMVLVLFELMYRKVWIMYVKYLIVGLQVSAPDGISMFRTSVG